MDSITQAALGAGIAGAMLGRQHGRKAIIAGAVLGTLPDLDILIDYGDPLSQMINHRGFSHSVFVLTGFSALLTGLIWRWRSRTDYTKSWLFLTIWLILITHIMLDAFTSYGTQLWWPFRPPPSSWSSVFIIDPLYTLPLLITVLVALIAGLRPALCRALTWVLCIGAGYLLVSLGFKYTSEQKVLHALQEQGHQVSAVFSAPQPFNIVLWRVVARLEDGDYIEAISGLFDRRPPEMFAFDSNAALGDALDERRYVEGLHWFTSDWLRYDDIDGQLVVTDLRMGIGTGHYSFRFLVGQRDPQSQQWDAITPSYWSGGPANRDMDALKKAIRRIWQTETPLPLAEWDKRMTVTND